MNHDRQDRVARLDDRKDKPANKPSDFPYIPFGSTICPNCGSHRTHVTRSEVMTTASTHRYHTCKKCNARFRSEEKLPFIDQNPAETE